MKDALRLLDEGRWNEAPTWDICGMCVAQFPEMACVLKGETHIVYVYVYIYIYISINLNTYSMGKSCDQ